MPLPVNIKALLQGKPVEWERLEFKAGWNPLSTLHTICAFANDFHNLGGGYIIIGVAEKDGRPVLPPVGLDPERIDAVQKELLNLGYEAIRPNYHPIVFPTEIAGRHVLILWVPGGQTRPYKAKLTLRKDGQEFGYFIRRGSSTVRAKGADEMELLSLAATVPFDDRVNQQARVEDLSRELMLEYLREVGSALAEDARDMPLVELGRMMGVVGGPDEAPFPLNVGLMMFNHEPHKFFPGTRIDVVWFPKEGAAGDTFSEKIFQGPIPRMTRDALDYLKRNFIAETVIKRPDRAKATRVENFPFAAVEEAVVNAVYHRGYDVREPVEIRVTAEDMTVLSYPGPDRSVRLEALRAGRAQARRYRNRRIGEFLKVLRLTEGRATGIPKIIGAMRANGSPPPEFDFDDDHSYFMARLPAHPAGNAGEHGARPPAPARRDTGVESETARKILAFLKDGELSRTEIAHRLGKAGPTRRLNELTARLLDARLIEYAIPEGPGGRLRKLRLAKRAAAEAPNELGRP